MTAWRRVRAWSLRLAGTFGAGRRDREIAEELSTHLEMLADEHRRDSGSDQEARRAAAARFGSVAAAVDACRDRRGVPHLEQWLRDLAFAVRSLRRAPMLAVSMVLVLGLGIGLGSTILMVLHTIVWRDLPVSGADRVAKLSMSFQGSFSRKVLGNLSRFSYPELEAYRQSAHAMDAVAGFRDESILWRHDEDVRALSAMLVTADYLRIGVAPATGRLLSSADAHAPVVISERLWRDAFAADPGVVGTTMMLDRRAWTVIGVVAAPFLHGYAGKRGCLSRRWWNRAPMRAASPRRTPAG